MSASENSSVPVPHAESPDPASHARNVYDEQAAGHVEDDDDDMDFEPTTDGSDENEFFESEEDIEAEFHGQTLLEMRQLQNVTSLHLFEGRSLIHLLSLNRCRRR